MKKNVYKIIFLLTAIFLWLPSLTPAEGIFKENSSGVQAEEISPVDTSSNHVEKIPSENTIEVQVADPAEPSVKEISPVDTSGNQVEKIPSENTTEVQIADPAELSDENPTPFQKFNNYFSGDLRILTYGVIQEPSKSSQNPNNNLIQLPKYVANLEIRPDLRFDSKYLELSIKPRAKFDFRSWEKGIRDEETQWDDDWYINEWLVRLKAWDRLFVSFGRENLQWGPSFLFSPSNPFFSNNGRSNSYLEVAGMDFARLVFIPHMLWTISFIANTNEGRNMPLGPDPFENTYALKIDYTGRVNYASLIVSLKNDINDNLAATVGFFGGWTISDAVLLYSEGSLTKGSNALYPQQDFSPLGVSMRKIHKDDADVKPIILIGASYTLENSGTFYLEYLHNDPGYSNGEADLYYFLRQNAAVAFDMGGSAGLFGKYILSQTINPGMRFLRKNYAMLQYAQVNIKNRLAVTLRWTQNIDDGSGQFLGNLSCSLGDHWELFSSGVINAGPSDTEFGSILNYQVMLGLKFTF